MLSSGLAYNFARNISKTRWQKECDLEVKASEMRFLQRIEEVTFLTKCVALRFENLLTASRYFFKVKDLR